jgi:hypothetical protein
MQGATEFSRVSGLVLIRSGTGPVVLGMAALSYSGQVMFDRGI